MNKKVDRIYRDIAKLTTNQLDVIERIIEQFLSPFLQIERNPKSDIITNDVLRYFGDILKMHNCFSYEPFTKDKFEYALDRTLNSCRIKSQLAPPGNQGHDIEISGVKVSLKTQADKGIKEDIIHISKFMELGKGKWGNNLKDLKNLLSLFVKHMNDYERIFSLRCLKRGPDIWTYELVEIPKELLSEAETKGKLRMMHRSTQNPKPGYCDVYDSNKELKFQLYFDGGSERKLQIQKLRKDLCILHGYCSFRVLE